MIRILGRVSEAFVEGWQRVRLGGGGGYPHKERLHCHTIRALMITELIAKVSKPVTVILIISFLPKSVTVILIVSF